MALPPKHIPYLNTFHPPHSCKPSSAPQHHFLSEQPAGTTCCSGWGLVPLHVSQASSEKEYSGCVAHPCKSQQGLPPSGPRRPHKTWPHLPLSLPVSPFSSVLSCIHSFFPSLKYSTSYPSWVFDLLLLLLEGSCSVPPLAACPPPSALNLSPSERSFPILP